MQIMQHLSQATVIYILSSFLSSHLQPQPFPFSLLSSAFFYLREHSKRGVTERGSIRICLPVHCLAARSDRQPYCHTQMRHPLLVEGRPNCARQLLAGTLSAPHVAATSYCDPSRHANVITPCLLTPCLNVPYTSSPARPSLPFRVAFPLYHSHFLSVAMRHSRIHQ